MRARTPLALLVGVALLGICPALGQPTSTSPVEQVLAQLERGPKGTLSIRGVQGTKDGSSLAGDEVEVTLFHRDAPIRQLKGALDAQGALVLSDVPVGVAVNPIVRIRHAGVQYQDEAAEMSERNTSAALEVKVYEVTDAAPTWKTSLRHLIAEKHPGFFAVSELVVVEHTGDRTWLGSPPDQQNRRATVSFVLPEGASDINLVQGFHGWCCSAVAGRSLTVQMPLMPGKMTYKFLYRVPMQAGATPLEVAMPVVTDRVAIFLPDDGTIAESATLTQGVTNGRGAARLRMFEATNVASSAPVGVHLRPAASAARAIPGEGDGVSPLALSLGGVGLIGLGVGVWRVVRGRRP